MSGYFDIYFFQWGYNYLNWGLLKIVDVLQVFS